MKTEEFAQIYEAVKKYYESKITTCGATPQGVDWNSEYSQNLRFEQLTQVLPQDREEAFSLLDYGCGYGALWDFIKERWKNCMYEGVDISPKMIETAQELHPQEKDKFFTEPQQEKYDYVLCSGIFNVKLELPWLLWEAYIIAELHKINQWTKKGFAFNMLTKYSDAIKVKNHLYYGDPLFFFDLCKRNFGFYVTLKHDYPIYEYTILVRKK